MFDCVHLRYVPGTLYEPPEVWCPYEDDYNCGENCPFREAEDDYDDNYDPYDEYLLNCIFEEYFN